MPGTIAAPNTPASAIDYCRAPEKDGAPFDMSILLVMERGSSWETSYQQRNIGGR